MVGNNNAINDKLANFLIDLSLEILSTKLASKLFLDEGERRDEIYIS